MWTVIYTTKNDALIVKICEILNKNAIIYRTKMQTKPQEEQESYCDVLVPAAEVGLAHELILDEKL